MSNINDFVIENGELKKYNGKDARVEIPKGVTGIGRRAFAGNVRLKDVVIPEGVRSIGVFAFSLCSGLTSVTVENPDDWWCSYSSNAVSGTELSSAELADSAKAAAYLSSIYEGYYWRRGEL